MKAISGVDSPPSITQHRRKFIYGLYLYMLIPHSIFDPPNFKNLAKSHKIH